MCARGYTCIPCPSGRDYQLAIHPRPTDPHILPQYTFYQQRYGWPNPSTLPCSHPTFIYFTAKLILNQPMTNRQGTLAEWLTRGPAKLISSEACVRITQVSIQCLFCFVLGSWERGKRSLPTVMTGTFFLDLYADCGFLLRWHSGWRITNQDALTMTKNRKSYGTLPTGHWSGRNEVNSADDINSPQDQTHETNKSFNYSSSFSL
jgi:hypothetical protein